MDRPSDISACSERCITTKQNTEAIKFVAGKLALIGDQLNQSYEECLAVKSGHV